MIEAFNIIKSEDGPLQLQGALDVYHIQQAHQALKKGRAIIDLSGLSKLDTVGALVLRQLQEQHKIKITELKPEYAKSFK